MTKAELIKKIADKTGIERAKVEASVEAIMATIERHVSNNETVSLRGFGNFIIKKRAAKTARNISKNTEIKLPAYYVPVFKPSKKFSTRVKNALK